VCDKASGKRTETSHNNSGAPRSSTNAGRDHLDDVAGQADLVFDTIGGDVLARSPALLRPGGTLVMIKADRPVPGGRGCGLRFRSVTVDD
jgi:NADPH:quinone reductase-like Zn-dependent oxidoreductase